MKGNFWLRALALAGLGALIGLGGSWFRTSSFEAQATLHFPGVSAQLYSKLLEALRASPDGPVESGGPSEDISQIASIIFQSQAAAEAAQQASASDADGQSWARAAREDFQQNLVVQPLEGSSLRLLVRARSGDSARLRLQGLLDYYSQFVRSSSLTRVRHTRLLLEKRLAETARSLTKQEEKMSRSQSHELRNLGDSALKANPKVMSQLWLRRLEQENRGRALLNQMQKIRGQVAAGTASDEPWMADWNRGRQNGVKPSSGLLKISVRPQDLQERAELERTYYDNLVKYRALILQQSFLLTWEELESYDFEILDPISVRRIRANFWGPALAGAALGLVLALLLPGQRMPR